MAVAVLPCFPAWRRLLLLSHYLVSFLIDSGLFAASGKISSLRKKAYNFKQKCDRHIEVHRFGCVCVQNCPMHMDSMW